MVVTYYTFHLVSLLLLFVDLKHIHVRSVDEALKVLTYGQKNLQYAYTKLNESSSRSHCIFNIKMIRVADKKNPNVAGVSQ